VRWLREAWVLPLPALAVHALVLLFSDRVWTDMATVHSRYGDTTHIPIAERQLILLAIAFAIYGLTLLMGEGLFEGRVRGMRVSTPPDRIVAMWMTRLAALAAMYGSALWLVKTYVWGSP
jgi:hypothetical protein